MAGQRTRQGSPRSKQTQDRNSEPSDGSSHEALARGLKESGSGKYGSYASSSDLGNPPGEPAEPTPSGSSSNEDSVNVVARTEEQTDGSSKVKTTVGTSEDNLN